MFFGILLENMRNRQQYLEILLDGGRPVVWSVHPWNFWAVKTHNSNFGHRWIESTVIVEIDIINSKNRQKLRELEFIKALNELLISERKLNKMMGLPPTKKVGGERVRLADVQVEQTVVGLSSNELATRKIRMFLAEMQDTNKVGGIVIPR